VAVCLDAVARLSDPREGGFQARKDEISFMLRPPFNM
jgi:hypothetical protein